MAFWLYQSNGGSTSKTLPFHISYPKFYIHIIVAVLLSVCACIVSQVNTYIHTTWLWETYKNMPYRCNLTVKVSKWLQVMSDLNWYTNTSFRCIMPSSMKYPVSSFISPELLCGLAGPCRGKPGCQVWSDMPWLKWITFPSRVRSPGCNRAERQDLIAGLKPYLNNYTMKAAR